MSYRFESRESVGESLRRISHEQTGKALGEIDDVGLDRRKTVHQVRKRCKKIRGLARLVRASFPDYAAVNAAARDTARLLSPIRDVDARLEALEALGERGGASEGFEPVHDRLEEERRHAMDALHDPEARLAEARERLVRLDEAVDGWRLDATGLSAWSGGFEKTYRRARRRRDEAAREPALQTLHTWRKRTKYHWHHLRLLAPVWRDGLDPVVDATKELSDALGDHRDLALLREELDQGTEAAVRKAAEEVQDDLLEEARSLGARLFAETPGDIATRFGRYWSAWIGEQADPSLAAGSAELAATGS